MQDMQPMLTNEAEEKETPELHTGVPLMEEDLNGDKTGDEVKEGVYMPLTEEDEPKPKSKGEHSVEKKIAFCCLLGLSLVTFTNVFLGVLVSKTGPLRTRQQSESRAVAHVAFISTDQETSFDHDLITGNFDPFFSAHEHAFVLFYAPWCVWCQRLMPTWESFAEQVSEDGIPVVVARVDCSAEASTCRQQKIQAFPTMRWFEHGRKTVMVPDYKSDRTVDSLLRHTLKVLHGEVEQDKEEGSNDVE